MKTSLKSKLASLDNFGISANLNIKGRDKVKTVVGAIVTLGCFVIIASYSLYQLKLMFWHSDSSISVATVSNFYDKNDRY